MKRTGVDWVRECAMFFVIYLLFLNLNSLTSSFSNISSLDRKMYQSVKAYLRSMVYE